MTFKPYKPNAADKKTIREGILKAHRMRRGVLRVSLVSGPLSEDESLNALLVATDARDAEAQDQISWADFCKQGCPLTADGDAVIDLLVYAMPDPGQPQEFDLRAYGKIHVKAGKLVNATGQD